MCFGYLNKPYHWDSSLSTQNTWFGWDVGKQIYKYTWVWHGKGYYTCIGHFQTAETASTGTDTPDVDSTPSTPSGSYPNTPSASSTWTNWPNPPNIGNNKTESGRPHTISSAYEKSHHSRPPLTSQLFEPPQQMATEGVGQSTGEQHDVAVVKRERPHSGSSMPYSRPSAAINKMQPVLPPLGPKPKSRAIAPPVVPPMGM